MINNNPPEAPNPSTPPIGSPPPTNTKWHTYAIGAAVVVAILVATALLAK